MERPLRKDFESLTEYKEARSKYVEWALAAGGRIAARMASLEERLAQLEKTEEPEPAPVDNLTIEEQIRRHAHDLIVARYSAIDQLNVTRKAARLGASKKEHLELERMDEWIDAVRAACVEHLAEVAAMAEDARPGYNWLVAWPKEA